jgi:solute carrier family 35 protein E1
MRLKPELTKGEIVRLLPIAFLHTPVHVGGVISMGAGAVSFTYIVKASEPATSAALSALVLKTFLPLPVYLTPHPHTSHDPI